MSEVRLEEMAEQHLDAVVALEQMCSSQPWSRSLFAEELAQGQPYVVAVETTSAESEAMVAGFAGFVQLADDAHITNVAVHPTRRRCGVATRLLLGLFDHAVQRGIQDVTLEVRASNEAAMGLYRRFGFAPEGIRRAYYSRPTEDAVILWARSIGGRSYRRRLSLLGGTT
jgi:ribosomal-protein-alanine N-acetyltransferase